MAEYLDFVVKHWVLSSAFGAVLLLFILNEIKQRVSGSFKLSPQQAVDLINHNDAVVIDVRSSESFNSEHIIGAQNIPQQEWDTKKNKLVKLKDKPIIVVCDHGGVSPKIAHQLQKEGFESIYCMAGGIAAWKSENLPLSK